MKSVNMLYLANPSTPAVRGAMAAGHIGAMITPAQGNRIPIGTRWALDNGCFAGTWTPQRFFDTLDRHAVEIGCDSADGTFIAFGPDRNLPRMLQWLDMVNSRAAAPM